MIISISGAIGSGKTTIAKKLAKELAWPRYYIGGLRRDRAKKRGMTLSEYNKLGEIDPSTDLEVDKYQEELGRQKDNFIIEGRTSWHFIPHSLKLYFDVEETEGAKRVFKELQNKNNRNEGGEIKDLNQVLKRNRARVKSDKLRYEKYFQIDAYDKKNYDYVIDTTNLTPKEVFEKVYQIIKQNLET